MKIVFVILIVCLLSFASSLPAPSRVLKARSPEMQRLHHARSPFNSPIMNPKNHTNYNTHVDRFRPIIRLFDQEMQQKLGKYLLEVPFTCHAWFYFLTDVCRLKTTGFVKKLTGRFQFTNKWYVIELFKSMVCYGGLLFYTHILRYQV